MASPYTGNPATFPTTITIPDDGDAENVSSVNVPFEGLADQAAHLNASRAPLANIAALTAILVPTDGLVRHVLGSGFYTFKTSVTSGSAPFWFAAGDATPGGWVSSTARRISVVGVSYFKLPTTVVHAFTTYTDVAGFILSVPCEAGDLLTIDAVIGLGCLGACSARVMLDDSGAIDPAEVVHLVDDGGVGNTRWGSRSFLYTAAHTGNVIVSLQAKYYAGAGVSVVDIVGSSSTDAAASSVRVMRLRA